MQNEKQKAEGRGQRGFDCFLPSAFCLLFFSIRNPQSAIRILADRIITLTCHPDYSINKADCIYSSPVPVNTALIQLHLPD
jgi:hypothetical protein